MEITANRGLAWSYKQGHTLCKQGHHPKESKQHNDITG